MSYDAEFGQFLKEKRCSHNLTQSQLANKLGITKEKVTSLESGSVRILLSDALNIANFFNNSMEKFIDDAFNKPEAAESYSLIPKVLDEIKFAHLATARRMIQPHLMANNETKPAIFAFYSNLLFWEGNFIDAILYARKSKALYPKRMFHDMTYQVAIMCEMFSLAKLDHREQALSIHEKALGELNEYNPMIKGVFLQTSAWLYFNLWDKENTLKYAQQLEDFAVAAEQAIFESMALMLKGWVIGTTEDGQSGIDIIERGWQIMLSCKGYVGHSIYSLCLCDVYKSMNEMGLAKIRAQTALQKIKYNSSAAYKRRFQEYLQLI